MRGACPNVLCAYCGQPGADELDHVIARQFFPPDQTYRGDLPRVPSCGTCNRKKQRVEDGPAVLFQFGDGSEASGRVLTERVSKTLAKNRRLRTSLRRGLQEVRVAGKKVFAQLPSGILIPALMIQVSERELRDCYAWFQFVARGLYCFELKVPLPAGHSIHLFWRKDNWFKMLRNRILRNSNPQTRMFASGEFQYTFALNRIEEMSLWFIAFKSIKIFALTIPAACPAKAPITRHEWPPPDEASA